MTSRYSSIECPWPAIDRSLQGGLRAPGYVGRTVPLATVYPLVSTRSLVRPFTYEVPEGLAKGAVVSVRLGRSTTRGVVTDVGVEAPPGIELSAVGRLLDEVPAPLVDLALWVADYYGSTRAGAPRAAGRAAVARRARVARRRARAGDVDGRAARGGRADRLGTRRGRRR